MKIIFLVLSLLLFLIQLFLFNMNEFYYQFIIFLVSYLYLMFYLIKKYNFMNPLTLFIFISFFYFTSGTFDLYFFVNKFKLEESTMGLLLLFSYSFVLFLVFFVGLFDKKDINLNIFNKFNYTIDNSNYASILYKLSSNLLILFIFLYVLKFVSMFGLSIGAFSRGELYSTKSFLLVLLKIIIPTTTIFFVWIRNIYEKRNKKRDLLTFLFIISFVLFDMLFKGDRRVGVSMILGVLAINYYMKSLPIKYIFLGIISSIGLFLLGAIRNRPVERWGESIDNFITREFSPSNGEFGPFSMIANYLLKEEHFISMPTYFNSLLSVIPSFLYPDRPIASSNWFTKTYFTDYYNSGGGWAFNMIVETTLNFGYFAPIILSIFYSLFFILTKQKGYLGILITAIIVYITSFSIRFDLTSIFQTTIYGTIGILILLIIGLLLKKGKYV
jgi:oligosaccharide repeat unit polymerase